MSPAARVLERGDVIRAPPAGRPARSSTPCRREPLVSTPSSPLHALQPRHRAGRCTDPPPPGRRRKRAVTGLVAATTALGATVLIAPSASAALANFGASDPATNFPAWYSDGNGLSLDLCLSNDAKCLATPDLVDVHAAGGDAEAFYYSLDAEAGPFALHDALEAAYAADGPDQEVVFQRTEVRARNAGLPANTDYTVT